jgi:hypothetical protein
LEVGDFQEDVGGGLGDAGVESAHDASDGEGFVLVSDDEVVRLEGAGLAIERDEGLALGGVAHDDAAVELGEVEGVQRLAHLHEDVVGDINEVVDGAQADAVQSLLQPLGAGATFTPRMMRAM